MDMKPNYYSIIPATVRYDKDLKANEKLLYGEITALAQMQGYCWASNGYFAELYGVSKETVSRWISKLDKKGYIRTKVLYVENSKQIDKRFIYISDTPIDKKINTPSQNRHDPIDENVKSPIDKKVKDNITSINNTSITNSTTSVKNDGEPSADDKTKKVLLFFENNFGVIRPSVLDDLTDYVDIFKSDELVIYAMQKAVDNNATFGYAKSIMQRWLTSKIMTLKDVKADELAFNNRKNKGRRDSSHTEIIPSWMTDKEKQEAIEEPEVSSESEEALRERLSALIGE